MERNSEVTSLRSIDCADEVESSAVRYFSPYRLSGTIINSHKFQPDKHEDALYHPERAQMHRRETSESPGRKMLRRCDEDRLKWSENKLRKCGVRNEIRFVHIEARVQASPRRSEVINQTITRSRPLIESYRLSLSFERDKG